MSHVCLWRKADITRLSFNVRPKKRIGHQTPRAVKVSNQCVLVSAKALLLLKLVPSNILRKPKTHAPLVITADLAATSKATITSRHGSTGSSVDNFEIRPSLTDVAAGVTPGPKIW